jgi:K+-sensing histidine kinase KdpD
LALDDAKARKSMQYIGEGLTFFVLIMVGAAYVYQAIRRQIKIAEQQQNFMMAITHELKTPIAVARLNLETLQKRKLQAEQQEKLIANTLIETNRLNTLTSNILIAAQLEGGKYHADFQSLHLSNLVDHCLNSISVHYPSRRFTCDVDKDIWINGEPLLIQILINNLLENAVKYSTPGSLIAVNLSRENNRSILSIIDEGLGIAAHERKKIFNKFYRVGSEAMRKTKGTGLGLFICKKIVQDHKGNITVINNLPQGSIFMVQIPLLKRK